MSVKEEFKNYRYFKYISLEKIDRLLDYVQNNRLFGAKYDTLNDPYEGRYSKEGLTEVVRKEIEEQLPKTRICAMFQANEGDAFPSNFLMWSHYANSHKGVCLEFTIDNQYNEDWEICPIEYNDESPVVTDATEESIKKIVSNKATMWNTENEVRAVRIDKDKNKSPFFHIKLKKVYYGMRIDPKIKDLLTKILPKINPKIELYQIFPSRKKTGNYPDLESKIII